MTVCGYGTVLDGYAGSHACAVRKASMKAVAAKSKVLIIDDDPGVRESLGFVLNHDFDVLFAETMAEGIDRFVHGGPSTVILDLNLPDRNGIDGLREIRRLDAAIPVIILTAYGSIDRARAAIRLGADDFLSKPFRSAEIIRTVQESVLRQRRVGQRNRLIEKLQSDNSRLTRQLRESSRMATLGKTSAEYAHDLCGPLTAVIGYVEFLGNYLRTDKVESGGCGEKVLTMLDAIENNVNRCYDMSRAWLLHSDSRVRSQQPVGICELLHELVGDLFSGPNGPQVLLHCNPSAEENCAVVGDRLQLYRSICNVVVNATQAVPATGGAIGISCCVKNDHAEIQISDNGCGIDADQLSDVFRPYVSSKVVGQAQGTGLGLYISKKIIEDHNGTITISSKRGKGSDVRIRLPLMNHLNQA